MITDQDLAKPLNIQKIKRLVEKLRVLDRMLISGQNYNVTNILADNYMRPDIYRVNGGLQDIHHSHFITAPALHCRCVCNRLMAGGMTAN